MVWGWGEGRRATRQHYWWTIGATPSPVCAPQCRSAYGIIWFGGCRALVPVPVDEGECGLAVGLYLEGFSMGGQWRCY